MGTTLADGRTRMVRRARALLRLDLSVPGDKSISHRAALFNAFADGHALLANFAPGADCASTLACLGALGIEHEQRGDTVHVHGVGLRGGLAKGGTRLDCGNSGTSMRLLAGVLVGQGVAATLDGDASLRRRPMARVVEPLRRMGARISGEDGNRLPPLRVEAASGGLRGGEHLLTVASAQVKSAILLAGLVADGPVSVEEPARSRDHTERLLRAMGADVSSSGRRVAVQPATRLAAVDVAIPGDFSSAAYWLVLGCLHPDAEVRVRHVGVNPTRTGLLRVLEAMGADVRVEPGSLREEAGEPVADLVARSSRLRATTVEGELVPLTIDELPLVALLGLFADGETVVRDAAELRVKESDRIGAVVAGLSALGGDLEAQQDGWRVRGGARLRAAAVDSRGDHRLAMLFALAAVLGEGAGVGDADAVAVSYPGFWDVLDEVNG